MSLIERCKESPRAILEEIYRHARLEDSNSKAMAQALWHCLPAGDSRLHHAALHVLPRGRATPGPYACRGLRRVSLTFAYVMDTIEFIKKL